MPRPLSEDARAKMLTSTRVIITERGIDGFTVDEVARRSGVAKSTIYRHFSSGDELMLAAVDDLVDVIEPVDTGSLRGDLGVVVREFVRLASVVEFRTMFVSLMNRARVDPDFAARLRTVKEQRHTPIRRVLQRGIARGEVDPEIDLELAMQFVQGPFVTTVIVEDGEISERALELYLDLIVRGLAPAGPAAAGPT